MLYVTPPREVPEAGVEVLWRADRRRISPTRGLMPTAPEGAHQIRSTSGSRRLVPTAAMVVHRAQDTPYVQG